VAAVELAAVVEMVKKADKADTCTRMATTGRGVEPAEKVVVVPVVVEPEETVRCRETTAMTAARAPAAPDPWQAVPARVVPAEEEVEAA